MIHKVSANKSSFHAVEFTQGLNVILAERTDVSTQKDTRNGLGKSTLIDIIDFCLGASTKKNKGLMIEPLAGWEFTLELTLVGKRVKATRGIDTPSRIVVTGDTTGWIEQPDEDKESGDRVISLERWKTVLGLAFFRLPRSFDDLKYKPSYRSLISYFIRRGPVAYTDPFALVKNQKTWIPQLNISYLLDLNWESASKLQELKDQEKAVKAIEDAVKTGAMEGMLGTVGELESERVQLEEQVKAENQALGSFRVHPQYEAIQDEADKVTAEVHRLTNENVKDRRRLTRYRESVASEKPPTDTAIEALYEETGLVFPDSVKLTLDQAKSFHSKIIENRRQFLETEVQRLERQISDRNVEIEKRTESRAASLEILTTHGALQEMTKLQERHVKTRGKLERVTSRIAEVKDLKTKKRELKVQKAEHARVAEQDHEERRSTWSVPVRLFSENSQALYKTPGTLAIDITEAGFSFKVEINRSGSDGVGNMKIFCFDLMLLELASNAEGELDFLVHDSRLFDGVDERQRALAIERASEVSEKTSTQYICTLNSDMIPRSDFSDEFDFDGKVRLTLTDKNPTDSLLGFHFERPGK